MAQDLVKKEALFNEVKGSLFEYLVARRLSKLAGIESNFLKSLDAHYLNVLTQQDRMVRQFYPEMLTFLVEVSEATGNKVWDHLGAQMDSIKLVGKFANTKSLADFHEADIIISSQDKTYPISLKLNKRNAFVNTKSGGIKSFFDQYFPFVSQDGQDLFNQEVDREFTRMAHELYAFNDMEFPGHFQDWVSQGRSELPGELSTSEREILKSFYARIARKMHQILFQALERRPDLFKQSLPPLMGFSHPSIIQVICFHNFKDKSPAEIQVHELNDLSPCLDRIEIKEFHDISSVEIVVGEWDLQLRVKPMNKFTTTAIKINCSVRLRSQTSSD